MNQAITLEVRFFLVSILSGVLLLVIYDILRILRIILKQGAVQIGIQDFLFWVASGVFIFRMMYQMNDGVIRGFSLAGIFLGMVVYKYSISDWIVHTLSKGILIFIDFIKRVIGIVTSPIRWTIRQIYRFLRFIARKVKKVGNRIFGATRKVLLGLYMGLKNKRKSYTIKREARREEKRALRAEKENAAASENNESALEGDAAAYTAHVAKREPMAVAVHQARVTSRVVHRE